MTEQQLKDLMEKYLREELSPDEFTLFWDTLQQPEHQESWTGLIREVWDNASLHQLSDDTGKQKVLARLMPFVHESQSEQEPAPLRRLPLLRRWWVAAAILILIASAGLVFNLSKKDTAKTGQQPAAQHDIAAPQRTHAFITLANKRQISIDSAASGTMAVQGSMNVVKLANGQVMYKPVETKAPAPEVTYNTLSNPRGSKVVSLMLSDGTRVWLNTASSITYPTAFTGHLRKVTVTGEAYFEVTHNRAAPFIVQKGETEVTVLGTHFNVNAYDDESTLKVTLLEGSVKLTKAGREQLLIPGQQAEVDGDGVIILHKNADTEEVMAWKNGFFHFSNATVETVMKQLARWYDVDVVYEGRLPSKHFGGEISRDMNASAVLKVIAASGVHFRIEEKKVIVLP